MRTNNTIEGYWNRLGSRMIYARSRESYVISKLKEEATYYEEKAKEKLFPNVHGNKGSGISKTIIFEKDPIISKTKSLIYNYLLNEGKEINVEKVILNPIQLPDIFDHDEIQPETDENFEKDAVNFESEKAETDLTKYLLKEMSSNININQKETNCLGKVSHLELGKISF